MNPRYSSFSAFKKYSSDITDAMTNYPGPLRRDVSGSVETYAARFRDARKAGLANGWITDARPLSVAMREGYVLIGTPEAIRLYEQVPVAPKPESSGIAVDFTNFDCAHHLCFLIRAKAFGYQPVIFNVGPLTQEQATLLETTYGVTLVPIPERPGTFTLL